MRVLSLNCGSTSLRWGLFETETECEIKLGAIEEIRDLRETWAEIRHTLEVLSPDAIGHRVVHGGEFFTKATRIDEDVLGAIEAQIPLAPAHNPRCLLGIHEAQRSFPDLPHVAVFDTAFHQTMPPESYRYALPASLYEDDRIRRYGFHGTSHRYASERAAVLLEKPTNAFTGITVHLGGGCSIAAIEQGRSVDTSMGMTPLEGLMMGTRSGDVDPAVVLQLASRPELGPERVSRMLNEESGLLGVSGVSSDLRKVERAAESGNQRAALALNLFAHRVRKGIGAALGGLGSADAVILTGGIGEHAVAMRQRIFGRLSGIGLELDEEANWKVAGKEARISRSGSPIAIFVVPAREEWLIARETALVLS